MTEHAYALGEMEDGVDVVSPLRRVAQSRQFALGHRDAAIKAASPGVWWAAFREGANYALTSSAKMSTLFQEVGEWIALLGEAREAAPSVCPHCGGVIE